MTGQLVKSLAKGGKYMLYGALAQGEPCQVGPLGLLQCDPYMVGSWADLPSSIKHT